MIPVLIRASLRDLTRHRWQTLLACLGIALGVAVVVAVDIANGSARRAFELSAQRVVGRATHRIESASGHIANAQYARLVPLLAPLEASPVQESTVRIGPGTFTLLGVDLLAFGQLRAGDTRVEGGPLGDLLARPGAILLPVQDAARLGLAVGDALAVRIGERGRPGYLAGVLIGGSPAETAGLALADIASAQGLTGRLDELDRIDLVLGAQEAADLAGRLPPGLRLVPAAQRGESLRRMTRAFQTNLTAMSLLALLVGGFIVYNAMTFAVLRRRPLLGALRTLGCTRGQLFALVLGESLALALLGSLAGLALGILTGWGLVQLVVRTIDDLYFTLTVAALDVSVAALASGVGLGLCVTLIAALGPALEGARSEPRDLLRPSTLEALGQRWVDRLAPVGLGLLAAGYGLAQVPSRSLGLGFLALLLVAGGFSLIVPWLLRAFAAALVPLARRLGGPPALLAVRGVGASIARTGVAVAALTVAISATVGVGIMIDSFRASLIDWLGTTLRSDFYLSAPDAQGRPTGGGLPPGLAAAVARIDGVAGLSQGRRVEVVARGGPVALLALESSTRSPRGFRFEGGTAPDLWARLDDGALILASQPFAYHRRVGVGDRVELFTPQGWRPFEIGGVFRDYGSDSGMLVMARGVYATLWGDPAVSTLGAVLAPGADPQRVYGEVRALAESSGEAVTVSPNGEIRERSLAIFDRTFAITRVLRLLAVGVAFVGVLSALMALQLERRREHAVLRATGLGRRGLAALVLTQTSVLGLAAGLLAIPLGLLMGDLLIHTVNLRSFGWTMDLRIPAGALAGGVLLAWVAALLAGVYPALLAARIAPADALRSE